MQATNEFSFILKPSPIGGVGVFALHDIEPNVELYLVNENYKSRLLQESEIPEGLRMFCVAKENDMWACPENFNRMELAWHLNHSSQPNAKRTGRGEFISLKDIASGDEITIDYNTLGEPESKKESYYKKKV